MSDQTKRNCCSDCDKKIINKLEKQRDFFMKQNSKRSLRILGFLEKIDRYEKALKKYKGIAIQSTFWADEALDGEKEKE